MDLTPFILNGRPTTVTGLHPAFRSSLTQMFASAPPQVQQSLRIASGYRPPEHQADLFGKKILNTMGPQAYQRWQSLVQAKGVIGAGEAFRPEARAAGVTKWVAPPGASNHQKGNAVDLKYLSPEATKWAHANAGKYGLRFPMSHENWHIEYAGDTGQQPMQMPAEGGGAAQPTTLAQQFAPNLQMGPELAPVLPPNPMMGLQMMQQDEEKKRLEADAEKRRKAALFGGDDSLAAMFG
jgi:LAS superfamily LD-carboxypeptidase LdcB